MKIVPAKMKDADIISSIISEANKEVAKQFKICIQSAPRHPSFYTKEWVLSDFERGEEYFLYKETGVIKGCVAFEQPDSDTAYLNRLSVMPEYRHTGIGALLVKHIFNHSKSKNIKTVSIGIIAEHGILKNWYLNLGFVEGDTVKFEHLPFNVTYMKYEL